MHGCATRTVQRQPGDGRRALRLRGRQRRAIRQLGHRLARERHRALCQRDGGFGRVYPRRICRNARARCAQQPRAFPTENLPAVLSHVRGAERGQPARAERRGFLPVFGNMGGSTPQMTERQGKRSFPVFLYFPICA